MRPALMRFSFTVALSALALAAGGPAAAQTPAPTTPKPGSFTLADFRALGFLEGNWKGNGYAPGPFYETYRVVNDSTIEMTGSADSTFTRKNAESSRYVFRAGQIRTDDGKAAVTHIDSLGYHFHTMQGQPYGWVFRRITADRWTATLGPTTVYTMDRVRR